MSELKVHNINDLSLHDIVNCDFYLKSEADKVIARHKYKRCLAMAWWCDTKGDWYYSLGENFTNCVDFYIKWRDKWLKIAEKFKQGLVIGVDEATGTDKTVVINYKDAK